MKIFDAPIFTGICEIKYLALQSSLNPIFSSIFYNYLINFLHRLEDFYIQSPKEFILLNIYAQETKDVFQFGWFLPTRKSKHARYTVITCDRVNVNLQYAMNRSGISIKFDNRSFSHLITLVSWVSIKVNLDVMIVFELLQS